MCALAKGEGENPSDIYDRVEEFIDKLYQQPLPVPDAATPGILTNGRARSMPFLYTADLSHYPHLPPFVTVFFMRTLETPETWGAAAQAFDSAMNGNASAVLDMLVLQEAEDQTDLQRSAVTCNDEMPFAPPTPEVLVDAALDSIQNISRFYYSAIVTEPDSGCQYWPFMPPERYVGPWNSTPKNPILIISNTVSELHCRPLVES